MYEEYQTLLAKYNAGEIEELSEVFGCEINFELGYLDHIVEEDITPDPEPNGNNTVIIIVIASAAVLALAAIGVVIFLKKKKATAKAADASLNSEGGEIND